MPRAPRSGKDAVRSGRTSLALSDAGSPEGADGTVCRTTLANGLTVLSEYTSGVRSVSLGVWVRRSSVHEPRHLMGISHFLEHLVFKGTRSRSAREIALALESLGGSLDAFTSREHTSFQARVLDEHLEAAADVLCDLVFRPSLRDADLKLERKVVLEEISMVEDTPDDLVFELHNEALWGDHPYGYQILGSRETIGALDVADVRALHSRAYQPQHMLVAAAGRVRHEDLLEALERTGWTDVEGGPADLPVVATPRPVGPTRRHVKRDGQQVQIVIGSPTVPWTDPRRYALSLVSLMLGGGMSSRLFQRVREELGLAYSIYSFQSFHKDGGMHGIHAGTAPGNTDQAVEETMRELDRVAGEGFPDSEIEAGKSQLKGQLTLSLESPSSRMYRMASAELYGEPFLSLDESLKRIEAITADEVAAVCREFFLPARQTVLTLGPSGLSTDNPDNLI